MGLAGGITVELSRTDDGRVTITRESTLTREPSIPSAVGMLPSIPQNMSLGTEIMTDGEIVDDPSDISDVDEDDDTVVVAFCGSVMEKYFMFRERCQRILDELVGCQSGSGTCGFGQQRRVVLEENGDGGILGAGILAAVVDKKELSS
jgi:hypothetical protein